MRGKGWRQEPFPGPLDLLMKLDKTYVETPGLRLLSDEMAKATTDRESRINAPYLALSAPPQEGKSSCVARAFPLWLLMRNPDLRIMVISYDNETSVRWGRAMKNALESHTGPHPLNDLDVHLKLRPGSEAVNNLELDGYIGGLACMSLKGGITGRPADVIILDDVVKDKATARSAAFKKMWIDQWQTAIVSRLSNRSLVVMDHTRWATDDPIGQQLATNGSRWRYVNIPAVVESRAASPGQTPVPVRDPLGRTEGEWLISARGRSPAEWRQKREDVGEQDFWALYQGQPYSASGLVFKKNHFRYWHPAPGADRWTVSIPGRPGPDEQLRHAFRFITVDLAASTRASADWTVAAAWAVAGTGELLLLDLRRVQVNPDEHWDEAVAPLVRAWECPVYLEGSQYGTDLSYTIGREGGVVHAVHPDADKYTRAVPAARRMGQGMVYFPPAGAWMPDFEDEILAFPTGKHDDQVDVLSYGHRVVSEFWVPPPSVSSRPATPPQIVREAFGGGWGDIASAPL